MEKQRTINLAGKPDAPPPPRQPLPLRFRVILTGKNGQIAVLPADQESKNETDLVVVVLAGKYPKRKPARRRRSASATEIGLHFRPVLLPVDQQQKDGHVNANQGPVQRSRKSTYNPAVTIPSVVTLTLILLEWTYLFFSAHFSNFTQWTTCTCQTPDKHRYRTCLTGDNCQGKRQETKECGRNNCSMYLYVHSQFAYDLL